MPKPLKDLTWDEFAVEFGRSQNERKYSPEATAPADKYWSNYNRASLMGPDPRRGEFYNDAGTVPVAPQMGPPPISANMQSADQARLFQSMVLQDLQNSAQGNSNSYAQQQLRASNEQAQAGARSLGSTIQGQGAGAAARSSDASAALIGAQGVAQANALALQEQQAAMAAYLQALQQQRGQDMGQAGYQAALANANQAQVNQAQQFALGQGVQGAVNQAQYDLGYGAAKHGFELAQGDLNKQVADSVVQAGATGAGALSSMFGGGKPASGSVSAPVASNRAIDNAFNQDALGHGVDFNWSDDEGSYA